MILFCLRHCTFYGLIYMRRKMRGGNKCGKVLSGTIFPAVAADSYEFCQWRRHKSCQSALLWMLAWRSSLLIMLVKNTQIKAESTIANHWCVIFKDVLAKMKRCLFIKFNTIERWNSCLCNCPLDEQIFTIIQKREQCAQVVPTADMVPNSIFTPTRSNFFPLRLGSMWCIIQAHHMSLSVNPSIFTKLC